MGYVSALSIASARAIPARFPRRMDFMDKRECSASHPWLTFELFSGMTLTKHLVCQGIFLDLTDHIS